MSAIFTTAPGTLVAISSTKAPTAALIKVAGLPTQNVIVTDLRVDAGTAFQVTNTIGGPQYMYPFGDKLQEIKIGLMVIPLACQSEGQNPQSAFGKLWQFYYSKRITTEKLQTVKITFANQTITGLVVSLSANATPANGTPIISCDLSMLGWAEDTNSSTSNTGGATADSGAASGTTAAGSTAAAGGSSAAVNTAGLEASGQLSGPVGMTITHNPKTKGT